MFNADRRCQLLRKAVRPQIGKKKIGLMLVAQPLPASPVQCWKLGMIISELVTNSVRVPLGGTSAKSVLPGSCTATKYRPLDHLVGGGQQVLQEFQSG